MKPHKSSARSSPMFSDPMPVKPARDDKGLLLALKPWLQPAEGARPVPIGLADLRGPKSWDLDMEIRSSFTSVYTKLGVGNVVAGSLEWDSTSASWEAMVGVNKVLDQDQIQDSTAIYETFWGLGLRVLLTAKTSEVGISVNAGVVAAMAEYRSASVQYEVIGVGLGPEVLAALLGGIPPFGTFDLRTQDALAQVRRGIADSLQDTLTTSEETLRRLQPVLIRMAPKQAPFANDFAVAALYRFVMQNIVGRLTFEEAMAHAQGWALPRREVVQKLYLTLADLDPEVSTDTGKRPTAKAIKRAQDWLNIPL